MSRDYRSGSRVDFYPDFTLYDTILYLLLYVYYDKDKTRKRLINVVDGNIWLDLLLNDVKTINEFVSILGDGTDYIPVKVTASMQDRAVVQQFIIIERLSLRAVIYNNLPEGSLRYQLTNIFIRSSVIDGYIICIISQ